MFATDDNLLIRCLSRFLNKSPLKRVVEGRSRLRGSKPLTRSILAFTLCFPPSLPSRGAQRGSLGISPSSCFRQPQQPLQGPSLRPRWQPRSSASILPPIQHLPGRCSAGSRFRLSRPLLPAGRSPVPVLRCESLTLQESG